VVDLFGPSPVELGQRSDDREASGSQAPNDLPLMAALSFTFDQAGQVILFAQGRPKPLLSPSSLGRPGAAQDRDGSPASKK